MSRRLRILQFGSTGQVAREMLARAPSHGVELEALSRAAVDLGDAAAVEDAILAREPDLVVNAAAYTAVDKAEQEEALAFAVNAAAPAAMARACRARGTALLHLSTDYVFDGSKAGAWVETDPTAPLNAYGRSKAAGEAAVLSEGGRAAVLRVSWLYSPYGTNFVKTMLRLRSQAELRVVDDQTGRPTAAADVAEFILSAAPRLADPADRAASGLFHLAGGGATTWRRLAEAVFELAGEPAPRVTPITTAEYPTPARRPRNSELDSRKLETVFGYKPRPWREALAETLHQLESRP